MCMSYVLCFWYSWLWEGRRNIATVANTVRLKVSYYTKRVVSELPTASAVAATTAGGPRKGMPPPPSWSMFLSDRHIAHSLPLVYLSANSPPLMMATSGSSNAAPPGPTISLISIATISATTTSTGTAVAKQESPSLLAWSNNSTTNNLQVQNNSKSLTPVAGVAVSISRAHRSRLLDALDLAPTTVL